MLKALGEEEFTDEVVNGIMVVAKADEDGKINFEQFLAAAAIPE